MQSAWRAARRAARMTQVKAAKALGIHQPYLSQLETGSRLAPAHLAQKAAFIYGQPTVLPVGDPEQTAAVTPDSLEKALAALGYPGFAHVRSDDRRNPAEVVFGAVVQPDLDARLVEALPWVMAKFPDLDWNWLRDNTKLRNAQNRLGYVVHLAKTVEGMRGARDDATLSSWEQDLEKARLANETTLCRESMPLRARALLRSKRPPAAAHWNVLTTLTADQLPYAR